MKVHLIGIAGYGMKVLALFLKAKGYEVSGSDISNSKSLETLSENGIDVWRPHNKFFLEKNPPDIVVYSLAISQNNEELLWAKHNKKPIFTRSQMLANLLPNTNSIGITGTDGKTTTTSMIGEIFYHNKKEYNLYVGGDTKYFNENIVYDDFHTFISELDESDPDFEQFSTEIATVTNLRYDHLENYNNNKLIQLQSFKKFLSNSKVRIINESIKNSLYESDSTYTFGLTSGDIYIEEPTFNKFSSEFLVVSKEGRFKAKLNVPYLHNIENSLAAALSCKFMGVPIKDSYDSLYYYKGVKRRFEIKFRDDSKKIYIIDDYAHNPNEVINTVKAAKIYGYKLVAIFQPHRYTRFKSHWKDFVLSLLPADEIIITDIFGAYEKKDSFITPEFLKEELINSGKNAYYMDDFKKIVSFVVGRFKANVVILTLGAGNITNLCDEIVSFYVR